MKQEKFYLRDKNEKITLNCFLHTHSAKLRGAVIVCPGGGYNICSEREAEPIAERYFAAGYHAFVLRYSLARQAAYPNPLVDLCYAIRLIRKRAEEWGIDRNKIAICGFSAGGHLAASLGVHWHNEKILRAAEVTAEEIRPNALILCYPVISTSWMENRRQLDRLIGKGNYDELYRELNLHACVDNRTPPCFIVHTFRDGSVPVRDSLNFASALDSARVPFELHIWPNGGHGMSLGIPEITKTEGDASFAEWMELSTKWLDRLFENPEEASASVGENLYSSRL